MTDFACHVGKDLDEKTRKRWRRACDKDLYGEHEGEQYCVLHFPAEEKTADESFINAVLEKLKQGRLDFSGVCFPPDGTGPFSSISEFGSTADFTGATFLGAATFGSVTFEKAVSFSRAVFRSTLSLTDTTVKGRADFVEANFEGDAGFVWTIFDGGADFSKVTFKGRADFGNLAGGLSKTTTFNGYAEFYEATFKGPASFKYAKFGTAAFYEAIFSDTAEFSGATFEDEAGFAMVSFQGGASFNEVAFKSTADFRRTKFTYANCQRASAHSAKTDFSAATFEGRADFSETLLEEATFYNANFHRDANFTEATFCSTPEQKTDFRRATFRGEVYFREAVFEGEGDFDGHIDFYRTNFLDAVRFIGAENRNDNGAENRNEIPSEMFPKEGTVSFMRARVEKPELCSFDSVQLRPSWFVGVDARRFNFTAVRWYGWEYGPEQDPEGTLEDEIRTLEEQEINRANERLAQTCRELSINYEENRDYTTSGHFHHWSMKAMPRDIRRGGFLTSAYGLLSGYGENPKRAFKILGAIWIVFAVLYTFFGPSSLRAFTAPSWGDGIAHAWHALLYSAGVMTRLRTEFVSPIAGLGELHKSIVWFLVTVQGVLGPLQIALFVLAVRRKLMR